ncbi:hypothetical protein C1645_805591 [Glomus cerebriforme]|uniref:Uncharacterized protein n=1 Tax=Glomus cerebriforme TaxID=658196 RepID=A0A397T6G1_9GLOM|nr:hypothetical protein C1645_805591 [Glomus cerebriforme]
MAWLRNKLRLNNTQYSVNTVFFTVTAEQVNEQEGPQSIVQAPLQELSKGLAKLQLVVAELQEPVLEQVPQVIAQGRVPVQPGDVTSRFKTPAKTAAEKVKSIQANQKKLDFILEEIIGEKS